MSPLLIFGASTRAAAFAAIRAGFDPICGDMFADADLRVHAREILHVPNYPHGLSDAVRHLPSLPWIYTGAMENSAGEVERLSAVHTLWGNPASVLRRCRDPWQSAASLHQHGLPSIELRSSSEAPPRDQTWLVKPLRSAAGRAIAFWGQDTPAPSESHYFQRFIPGNAISGAFLAAGEETHLLGVSRQLIGLAELRAPPFGYCGSIFPDDSTPQSHEMIQRIGTVLGREFGLRGLFGIDFIHDGQQVWMTEINPRYTASMELIEYGLHRSLLQDHQSACDDSLPLMPFKNSVEASGMCAKVILYADRHVRAPDLSSLIPHSITLDELPQVADIPVAGTDIWPGHPVFTCLGTGTDSDTLVNDLIRRAQEIWMKFEPR